VTTPLTHITEEEFQSTVNSMARAFGWRYYHTYDSRMDNPGFPDLVLTRDGRIVFAELKIQKGRASEAQKGWLEALQENEQVEVYLWRPSDLDEIERILRR
jgi:hypothetical protein